MKENMVKTGKWMLVVLFLSYYISVTCFYHTHVYSWGTVTHSHLYFPFGDNPGHHNHTQTQCQTIQLLSFIVFAVWITAVISATVWIQRIYVSVQRLKTQLRLIASPLLAPPVEHKYINMF